MHILLTVQSLNEATGGPPRSVCGLASGLAALGTRVTILTTGKANGKGLIFPDPAVEVFWPDAGQPGASAFLRQGLALPRLLGSAVADLEPDVVHDNGVWSAFNHAVSNACARRRVPRVVATRGMLTSWSVRHKRWRKRLAWLAYQRRDLQRAALIHATAESELEDLRALSVSRPMAVVANGSERPPASIGESRVPGPYVLFLSRIHPKKGLLELVEAWRRVRPLGWRLVIAGHDEGEHQKQVEQAARQAGIRFQSLAETESGNWREAVQADTNLVFTGTVAGQLKWSLINGAALFVLPTHSENFGIVICEALSCGVPVITTKGTPWEELETHRCGWWVDIGVGPLAEALREALALSEAERREMGLRGRKLVEEKYSWPKIAAEMKAVYEWVLGGGPKPGCVTSG